MNYVQMGVAAVAIVVAFWPKIREAALAIRWPKAAVSGGRVPSYQDAIANLAAVRLRLRATEVLDDARKAAIDSLTLALVEGSDK